MKPNSSGQGSEYGAAIREAVADEKAFFRLTASGKLRGEEIPWIKVAVRPVLVKGRRRMRFSYFDGQKDITKNFVDDEAKARLEELLSLPFSHFYVQSGSGDFHVRITKKGKAFIRRGKPSRRERQPALEHDHRKHYPLPAEVPDPFLQGLGVMTEAGQVRAAMQAKFRQVNQFLKLMEEALQPEEVAGRWGSRVILAAPCCQHEFYAQLRASLFRPVLRHGILKQRLADILTDAFRALILRIMGYRTDVVEFISPEYTAKNLMIRAVKALKPGDKAVIKEYKALKEFWQVEPSIERLLGERL